MCSRHSGCVHFRARAPRPRSPPAARPPSSVYRGEGAERAQDGRLTRRRTRASLCGRGRCTRREREKETPLTAKSARRRAMACARCRGASRKRRKRRASSAAEVARAPRALREGRRRAHRERRRRACLRSRVPAAPPRKARSARCGRSRTAAVRSPARVVLPHARPHTSEGPCRS